MRFHGSSEPLRRPLHRPPPRALAAGLRALPRDVREVYVYFNNDALGYAIDNANTLCSILREAGEQAP